MAEIRRIIIGVIKIKHICLPTGCGHGWNGYGTRPRLSRSKYRTNLIFNGTLVEHLPARNTYPICEAHQLGPVFLIVHTTLDVVVMDGGTARVAFCHFINAKIGTR